MKKSFAAVPLSVLMLTGSAVATAQSDTTSGTTAPSTATTTTGDKVPVTDRQAEKSWERTHRASKIIGTDVRNRQGQKIGDIKDVVLDTNGQIAYTVVSTGGFLGMGDRMHAIPWTALQKDGENNYFVLDIDKERLKKAPGFDSKHWPNMADERWNADTRGYYSTPSR